MHCSNMPVYPCSRIAPIGTLVALLITDLGVDGLDVCPQVVISRGAVLALGALILLLLVVDGPDVPSQRLQQGASVVAVRARLVLRKDVLLRTGVHCLDMTDEGGSLGGHKVALSAPVAEELL